MLNLDLEGYKSGIARRLIIYVVLFSSLITLLSTAIQLYRDYKNDIDLIENQLQQVQEVHLKALIATLWVSDIKELRTHLEGISQLRDMQFLEIRDQGKVWVSVGTPQSRNVISHQYPMIYSHRGRDIKIGTLTVVASLAGVYQRLFDKVWVVLVSNGIKTFLVAGFIFIIFHTLITRHLIRIADFAHTLDIDRLDKALGLDREVYRKQKMDELDLVVNAINQMQVNIKESLTTLRQNEERFKILAKVAPVGIFRTDAQGNYIYTNERWRELAGMSEAEALGEGWVRALHSEDREQVLSKWYQAAADKVPFKTECRFRRPDGKTTWLLVLAETELDAEDQVVGYVGAITDITERKHAEEELHLRATALESAANGIVITDRAGEIQWVNPAFTAITGYGFEEAVGQNPRLLKSDCHDREFYQELWDTILSGRVWRGELINRRKDGSLYTDEQSITPVCNEQGKITHFVAIKQDVTERKRGETALAKNEETLKFTLDSTSDGSWNWNVATGDVVFSDRWLSSLGYKREEVKPHVSFWESIVHPDDMANTLEAITDHFEGRTEFYKCENRLRKKSGEYRWNLDRGKVIERDNDGKPLRMVGTDADITERKHAEEAIKHIAAGISSKSDADFFQQMVAHLAKLYKADYALIGLLDDSDPEIMHTLAVSAHGEIIDNLSRSLKDSPCANVANVAGQKTCIYPSNVQQQFPKDTLLQELGVEGYIGTPMFDSHKKPIGILVVLDGKPLEPSPTLTDILEIFAARAGAELERSRAEQHLDSAKQKLSLHVQQTPLGVIEWSPDFKVAEWNPAAEKMFGYTREEAMGRHAVGLIVPESIREQVNETWGALLENRGGYRSTNENITKDGYTIMCEWYNTPLVADNGKVIGVTSLVDDVTARLQAEKAVHHLAYHDALTGLVNRSEFEQRLQQLLDDTRNQDVYHALLYMDLDQFKVINDTCGHAAGDAMLKALTGLLQDQVRESDTLARLGGDEFGILLTGCPQAKAQRIAEDIVQAIKGFRFDWKGVSFEIGASIGMVLITRDSPDLAKILSAADVACYMAKEKGRGRVHIHAEDDTELARRHSEMEWVSRIGKALEDNRFLMYQQDIVPLRNGRAATAHRELLLRLRDEDGQLIQPDQFIPPAERYNLMPSLDRWVIRQAFTHIAMLPSNSDLYSINLSGTSLNDHQLVDFISEQFEKTGLSPARICFEITETAAISNLARAAALIQQLKSLGCLFSLDDFGKGASSFTYLKNLSVDYLKIDGGFVTGFIEDPADYAIIESINNVGHSLGIQTIAECVEDELSLDKLRKIGVDYAQGYVIGRPTPFPHTA